MIINNNITKYTNIFLISKSNDIRINSTSA